MSEVRGRSREDPMPEGRRPRGVTPHPSSGAAAESTRLWWHRNCQEELPKSKVRAAAERTYPSVWGQGRWLGGATPRPQAWGQGRRLWGATPPPRLGMGAGRTNHTPEARDGGWEELPHAQGHRPKPGGPTPPLMPGTGAGRTNPTSKELWLRRHRRA